MVSHVRFGQLHSDREQACGEHDAHDLEGNSVRVVAPRPRVERIGAVGTDDNAERRPEHDLIDVQLGVGEGFQRLIPA